MRKLFIILVAPILFLSCSKDKKDEPQPIENPARKADSLALVKFYETTDGDNWYNNKGWKTKPLEQWEGVTIENDRVTELDFDGNNLTGKIPAEIGDLTELEILNLGNNKLTNIPSEIGNLTKLRTLLLNANYRDNEPTLTGIIPTEIGKLSSLRELDIYGGALTGNIPSEMGNLHNLIYLCLAYNNLTGSIPAGLGGLEKLTTLQLDGNNLTGEVPSSIVSKIDDSNYRICPQQGDGFSNYVCN